MGIHMKKLTVFIGVTLLGAWFAALATGQVEESQKVVLLRVPGEGCQPHVVVDSKGTVHMVFLAGSPKASNVYYVTMGADEVEFSTPIRVNSQDRCAIAIGTIRGAHLAIGKGGRVHVAWNGNEGARPKGPGGTPFLYARMNDGGTAFEEQRNIITWAGGIDGGGSIAADPNGHVYLIWHARGEGKTGEENRAVFMARSDNNGKEFDREVRINVADTGACGCCGLRASCGVNDSLYVLYRTAEKNIHRDATLLISGDQGKSFSSTVLGKWESKNCVMSTASILPAKRLTLFAWETMGNVYFANLADGQSGVSEPVPASKMGDGYKHPSLARNAEGEILLVWTQGTSFHKGGALVWQLFDAEGSAVAVHGEKKGGIPTFGLAAAFARQDGTFVIVH